MRVNGTDIFMTRGDSERFEVSLFDKELEIQRNFVEGDKVFFTVKTSTQTKEFKIQKIIESFNGNGNAADVGKAIVIIDPEDTKDLKYHTYVYDVQMIRDGFVTTIIKPSKFVIEEEVTYDYE